MNNLNKKQKIILGVFISIVLIGIWYYVYAKEEQEILLTQENLEVEGTHTPENIIAENDNEKTQENEVVKESQGEKIVVHVSGAVRNEGIFELQANSRVADAIEKAGGLTEQADTELLNLASKLEDGMKIHVITKEEKLNSGVVINQNIITTQNKAITNSTQTQKVNINTASQTELETLPGIGPSTALKIINYRNENGKFKSIEEIKEVSGIGDSKYNQIKEMISIN